MIITENRDGTYDVNAADEAIHKSVEQQDLRSYAPPPKGNTKNRSIKAHKSHWFEGKRNYVFSRTLSKAASPKVSIVSEDVHVFSERLRSEKGKDIWLVGGAELVAAFLDCGQVDEFIVHVIPKMIGKGCSARPKPLKVSSFIAICLCAANSSFSDGRRF